MTSITETPATLPNDYQLTRRGAAAAIAAGYAAIATAADADPIVTGTDGLVIESVTMGAGLPGYVARPAAAGRHKPIIVVSEIFGVHEWVKDVCRRLAKQGFVAVAPYYFHRADPAGTMSNLTDMASIRTIVGTETYPLQMQDTGATLEWLGKQAFVAPGKAGIIGFCWGGSVVWLAAAQFAGIGAGGAFYGRLRASDGATDRPWPMDRIADLKAPVLGFYGGKDRGIPATDVEAMNAALAASSNPVAKASKITLYPDADHGFVADYRPSYNAAAASDAFGKMVAHMKASL